MKIDNKKLEDIKDYIDDNGVSLLEHCLVNRKFDLANEILDLKCLDREETIKTFNEFNKKSDKTIY